MIVTHRINGKKHESRKEKRLRIVADRSINQAEEFFRDIKFGYNYMKSSTGSKYNQQVTSYVDWPIVFFKFKDFLSESS